MRNMTIHILEHNDKISFPPLEEAKSSGLLAIGGDLSVERLLSAYKQGIFPWYGENGPIMWWSPDPRCVLLPHEFKISRSLQKIINKNTYQITVNKAFKSVISQCAQIKREGQNGTWLQPEMIDAYTKLHRLGYAYSVEAWDNDELVGGLYGIVLGKVFFGESMFFTKANASKVAFATWVKYLQENDFRMIDCQQTSSHMIKMGAKEISRNEFTQRLAMAI